MGVQRLAGKKTQRSDGPALLSAGNLGFWDALIKLQLN